MLLYYCECESEGSVIYYYNDEQKKLAEQTRDHFNSLLKEAGRNSTTTEILPAPQYNYAEEYRKFLHLISIYTTFIPDKILTFSNMSLR